MGKHILLSLHGVEFHLLDDQDGLKNLFDLVAKAIGATVLNKFFYKFSPQGVTVLYCLAESHMSLHSFPEDGSVAIDIFTCGEMDTRLGAQLFVDHFNPQEISMQEVQR